MTPGAGGAGAPHWARKPWQERRGPVGRGIALIALLLRHPTGQDPHILQPFPEIITRYVPRSNREFRLSHRGLSVGPAPLPNLRTCRTLAPVPMPYPLYLSDEGQR